MLLNTVISNRIPCKSCNCQYFLESYTGLLSFSTVICGKSHDGGGANACRTLWELREQWIRYALISSIASFAISVVGGSEMISSSQAGWNSFSSNGDSRLIAHPMPLHSRLLLHSVPFCAR